MSQDNDPTEESLFDVCEVVKKVAHLLSHEEIILLAWATGIDSDLIIDHEENRKEFDRQKIAYFAAKDLEDESGLEPHQRKDYAEKVYMQADDMRKWRKENGC